MNPANSSSTVHEIFYMCLMYMFVHIKTYMYTFVRMYYIYIYISVCQVYCRCTIRFFCLSQSSAKPVTSCRSGSGGGACTTQVSTHMALCSLGKNKTSWWFQPIWKILVKLSCHHQLKYERSVLWQHVPSFCSRLLEVSEKTIEQLQWFFARTKMTTEFFANRSTIPAPCVSWTQAKEVP